MPESITEAAAPSATDLYALGRDPGESARLQRQSGELRADSTALLDRVGLGPGQTAIDLGCGPSGIIELLVEHLLSQAEVLAADAADLLDRIGVAPGASRSISPAGYWASRPSCALQPEKTATWSGSTSRQGCWQSPASSQLNAPWPPRPCTATRPAPACQPVPSTSCTSACSC